MGIKNNNAPPEQPTKNRDIYRYETSVPYSSNIQLAINGIPIKCIDRFLPIFSEIHPNTTRLNAPPTEYIETIHDHW